MATLLVQSQPEILTELTLTQAAALISAGDLSAETYAEALIESTSKHEQLNTLISRDFDALLKAARDADRELAAGISHGPLHGVPIALKDNIATTQLPTSAGTGALRNYAPDSNASAVQRLFDAGALLFGKTNMHELAAGITSNNAIYGAVRNPYDPAMITGGSSGGTAAAIAANLVPAGLGTDTGGSCRIPAALCGIAGMRPTQGYYPDDGHVPFRSATATIGPMARNVADLALLDSVISRDSRVLPAIAPGKLRLGIPMSPFQTDLGAELTPVWQETLRSLEAQGVTLVPGEIVEGEDLLRTDDSMLSQFETRRQYMAFFAASGIPAEDYVEGIGDTTMRRRLANTLLSPAREMVDDRENAANFRSGTAAKMARYFAANKLDAMLIPTTPLAARPIGHDKSVELNGRKVSTFRTYIRNTVIASAAGIPAIAIPAGMTGSGLPIGIELDGPAGSDRQLLAIAATIEGMLPKQVPPAA